MATSQKPPQPARSSTRRVATKPASAPAKSAAPAQSPQAAVPRKPADVVKAAKPGKASKVAKRAKPVAEAKKREKLVRDSFTIPKAEYAALAALKKRAEGLARPAKKSELLRAGVKLLVALDDAALLAALTAVPTIKTGRPAAA